MNRRVAFAVVLLASASTCFAQSTAFTYQGELKQSGQLAVGVYDMRFRLFDAALGGAQVGSTVCVNNIAVTEGKFSAIMDFGQQFASSAARFVEIDVRADTGLDCSNVGGFVLLAPRQQLTATPRALAASIANAAYTLSAPDGSPANAVVVDNSGSVGVGTAAPGVPLHIVNSEPVLVLQDTSANSQQSGYLGFWNSNPSETAWVGFGTPGSPHFGIPNARSGGDIFLSPGPSGSVRVGSGGPRVAAAEENVRIIRGRVNASGGIVSGTGFTATANADTTYTITFATPFVGPPAVTVTAEYISDFVGIHFAMTEAVSASSVRVRLYNDVSTRLDGAFSFIAVGPR